MISVCINNYNYGKFISETIESVLNQSYKDFELIIVDDGSRDNSREIIENFENKDNRIKAIYKKNGGQLSSFNATLPHIERDIVTFLDSDDRYKPDYLESIAKFYIQNPNCDFLFTNHDYFDKKNEKNLLIIKDTFLGKTKFLTLFGHYFIGSVTSVISMKKHILEKILPAKNEQHWITRADNILVWGSSIANATKYYLSKSLVEYRVHSSNNYYGQTLSKENLDTYNKNMQEYFNSKYKKNEPIVFNDILEEASLSQIPFYYYRPILRQTRSKNFILKLQQSLKIESLQKQKNTINSDIDYSKLIV